MRRLSRANARQATTGLLKARAEEGTDVMETSMVKRSGGSRTSGSMTVGIAASPSAEQRNRSRWRVRRAVLALFAVLFAACATAPKAAAEDLDAPDLAEPKHSDWSFQVIPYLWLPELQGTVSTRGRSAAFNVDFDKVFDLLGNGDLLAGMGHFEAKYRRLSLFVDAIGGTARPSSQITLGPRQMASANGDLTMNFTYVEFGPAYRLLDLPVGGKGRSIALEVLAGGRFMYFYQSITLAGTGGNVTQSANATTTWVDPFVGGRWSVPLVGDLNLIFRGDIGGFGAGSELAWNLIGGFQYELPWHPGAARTFVIAAYKAFDFDYQTGSGDQKTAIALDQRGPAIGLGFAF